MLDSGVSPGINAVQAVVAYQCSGVAARYVTETEPVSAEDWYCCGWYLTLLASNQAHGPSCRQG